MKSEQAIEEALKTGKAFASHYPDEFLRTEIFSAWLLGITKGLQSYKEGKETALKTWLITKARYEALTFYKQYKEKKQQIFNDSVQYDEALLQKKGQISEVPDIHEVIIFLPELSIQEQFVIIGLLQDLTVAEISKKMFITAGRVSQIKKTALLKLKVKIDNST